MAEDRGPPLRVDAEGGETVRSRLGRLAGARGPGLVLLVPIVDRMVRVTLRVVTMDVAPQDVITRDNVSVKVNGSAIYSIDIELDGMVYAAVKQTPVPFGKLVKYDASVAKARPGVLGVVEFRAEPGKRGPNDLQDAIAVVADSYWRARKALAALELRLSNVGIEK